MWHSRGGTTSTWHGCCWRKAPERTGYTQLLVACLFGDVYPPLAARHLDSGADLDRTDDKGRTPLLVACWQGHVDAARVLLENGARRSTAIRTSRLLFVACEEGHVDAARLLLEKGAEVESVDKYGQTPLYSSPARTATSTRRGCCWTKARRSTGRRRKGGRRCTSPARRATSTRRGCCWTTARRSIGRRRTARRRCTSPARTATSTRRGCCWTKARRSIGRRRRPDAAVHRLHTGPRRRGAAVAGQRRGGRSGGRRARRRCTSPARRATSTRRGCCWTTARRSTGRKGRCDAAVHRLPAGPRRRGAAVAGLLDERRGTTSDEHGLDATVRCVRARAARRRGAAVAGQRRGGRSGEEGRFYTAVRRLLEGPRRRGAAAAGQRRGGSIGRQKTVRRRCQSRKARTIRPSSRPRGASK